MNDGGSETVYCSSCGTWVWATVKRCPHCGRPMDPRGFFFYAFWIALSLVVVGLIARMFYVAFEMLNRML